MVISEMQSLRTLFITFTMCATALVPPCRRVHIRTRPRGVRIVVMFVLSTANWNWYGQKPIMPMETTISSWMAINWSNEMSREQLLAARIRQLERRLDDVERATARIKEARIRNKARFD